MAPLAVFTRRFELRYSRDARRAQDLTGDLATVGRGVGARHPGHQVLRPPPAHAARPSPATRRGCASAELTKIRTLAGFWALLGGLPQLVLAGVTGGGVLAVAHGALSLGQLVAFLTLYLRLIWPIIALGWLLALTQEAASPRRRIFEVLDTQPTILDPETPGRRPSQRHHAACSTTSGSAIAGRRRPTCCAASTSTSSAGETMALVGAAGSGKTTLTALVPRLLRRHRRPGRSSAVSTCATCGWTSCAHGGDRVRGRHPVLGERAREPDAGPAGITDADVAEALEVAQAGLRLRAAVRAGHPDRRAGAVAVRRPAPAAGAGPRRARPTAGAGARRPAVGARRAHRGPGRGGAAAGAGRRQPRWSWRTGRRPCCSPTGWRCS